MFFFFFFWQILYSIFVASFSKFITGLLQNISLLLKVMTKLLHFDFSYIMWLKMHSFIKFIISYNYWMSLNCQPPHGHRSPSLPPQPWHEWQFTLHWHNTAHASSDGASYSPNVLFMANVVAVFKNLKIQRYPFHPLASTCCLTWITLSHLRRHTAAPVLLWVKPLQSQYFTPQ